MCTVPVDNELFSGESREHSGGCVEALVDHYHEQKARSVDNIQLQLLEHSKSFTMKNTFCTLYKTKLILKYTV